MTKYIGTLTATTLATLSIISCSTLRTAQQPDAIQTQPIEILDTLVRDTVTLVEPAMDSLQVDSLCCAEVDVIEHDECETEEAVEEIPAFEPFHFEGSETAAVVIDEFRHTVVEDTTIDLREWASHYPADGHVTSVYGWRKNRMHAGIDLKAYTGDNLYAAFDGVVRLAKYYSSFGNCIIIRHYNGLETLYAHASKLMVKVNDQVKAGDVIALAGNTGRSTGSHLHFETRINGYYFNPALILDTKNRQIKDTCLYLTMRNGRLFASNNDNEQEREEYIMREISIKYYTVKRGDVLSRIAVNNGTTVTALCRLNGIKSTSTLRIGQRLIVRDGVKPATTTKTTTTASSTKPATTTSSSTSTYTVKSGDNLSSIAKRHGTTVAKICELNGISRNSTLQIGQKLKLSGSAAATSSAEYYKVKKGDTLSSIARRYGTTITKICDLSNISRNSTLQIGQRLRVK